MKIPNTANTFEELHSFFNQFNLVSYRWLYRGQADISWKLKPKIGRDEYNVGGMGLGRFRAWKRNAVAHVNLPENAWEQLAIAQHYGLSTCLLDWSENPLVATFFAVYEKPSTDGIVYIYSPGSILLETIIDSPFFVEEALEEGHQNIPPVSAYYPTSIDTRIINQKGVFTIHTNPHQELKSFEPPLKKNLFSIRITAEAKKDILNKLQKYGIDYHYLFPDLGGLSELLNHETRRVVKERTERKNIY